MRRFLNSPMENPRTGRGEDVPVLTGKAQKEGKRSFLADEGKWLCLLSWRGREASDIDGLAKEALAHGKAFYQKGENGCRKLGVR